MLTPRHGGSNARVRKALPDLRLAHIRGRAGRLVWALPPCILAWVCRWARGCTHAHVRTSLHYTCTTYHMTEPHRSALDALTRTGWDAPRVASHVAAINAGFSHQREKMKIAVIDALNAAYKCTQTAGSQARVYAKSWWREQAKAIEYTHAACLNSMQACASNWRAALALDDVRDACLMCNISVHNSVATQLDALLGLIGALCVADTTPNSTADVETARMCEHATLLAAAAHVCAQTQARAYADLLIMASAARAAAPPKRDRSPEPDATEDAPRAKRTCRECACQTDTVQPAAPQPLALAPLALAPLAPPSPALAPLAPAPLAPAPLAPTPLAPAPRERSTSPMPHIDTPALHPGASVSSSADPADEVAPRSSRGHSRPTAHARKSGRAVRAPRTYATFV